jgi:hypothetical protein
MILLILGGPDFNGLCWGQGCLSPAPAGDKATHTGVHERADVLSRVSKRRGCRSSRNRNREAIGYPRGRWL